MSNISATTSEIYWLSAALLTMIDLTAIYCLSQCITTTRFRQAKFEITLTATLFWGGLWTAMMANNYVWESAYCLIFSKQERWLMPPAMAILYGFLGFGMWWIATKSPINPIISFALIGGLLSLPDHFYSIVVKDVLDTPLLSSVSAASAFVFGIFEFVFYWVLILSIAIFARSMLTWWTEDRQNLFKYMLRP